MTRIASFDPVAAADAEVLILGTMPGKDSLQAQQYYANRRNSFWPIMCDLLGLDVATPYGERLEGLRAHRIALWDVLAHCTRVTSLDVDIANAVANDFVAFFAAHPRITSVYFNGAAAEQHYRKQVLPRLDRVQALAYVRLPSTSPAHAVKPAAKREAWAVVVRGGGGQDSSRV